MKHGDKLEPLSYFDKLYILRGKNRALAIAQGKPVVLDRLALRRHVNEYYAAHPGLAAAPDPVWEAVLTNGEAPIDVICRAAGDFSRPAAPAPLPGRRAAIPCAGGRFSELHAGTMRTSRCTAGRDDRCQGRVWHTANKNVRKSLFVLHYI